MSFLRACGSNDCSGLPKQTSGSYSMPPAASGGRPMGRGSGADDAAGGSLAGALLCSELLLFEGLSDRLLAGAAATTGAAGAEATFCFCWGGLW